MRSRVAANSMKHAQVFMQTGQYFCPISTNCGFPQQIFVQSSISNVTEIRGSRTDTGGQTDGQT